MSYAPETRPVFDGDDWHELRDEMYRYRADAMARVAGLVFDFYRRSAIVLGREDDAVLDSLRAMPQFDLRTLMVAHGHLAGFWRREHGHVDPSIPHLLDLLPLVDAFHDWLRSEASLWIIDNPLLIRRFALVLVQQNTAPGIVAEMDLWDELKAYYPLPPPRQGDFFDDPASWSPYP